MGDAIIRPATIDDTQKVRDLRLKALKNDPQAFGTSYDKEVALTQEEWDEKFLRTQGDNPSEFLFLAIIENEIVGMVGAFLKENIWMIKAMYVDPKVRGRGIGKQLLSAIIERITSKSNSREIRLFVNTLQAPAVELYKGMGFKIIETLKNQVMGDGKTYDEFLMGKKFYNRF